MCPVCLGPNETVHHVCLCTDHRTRLQWIQSVEKCAVALNKAGTDPAIITVICQRLMAFGSRTARRFTLPAGTSEAIRTAVRDQDRIGWQQFLRGRLSKRWVDAQELWIIACSTKWKRSSSRWATKAVEATLEITWELWQHRNRVLHHPNHPWKQEKIKDINETIIREVSMYQECAYLEIDRHLFQHDAQHMVDNYSTAQKEQWVQSVCMARLRKTQTQELTMKSSRTLFENWLSRGGVQAE